MYDLLECQPASAPMVANTWLSQATEEDHHLFIDLKVKYRTIIGLLNYLSVSTRPDISFTCSQLSQHLKCPSLTHWKAVTHLLCYLLGSTSEGIMRDGTGKISDFQVYTDTDFANCPGNQKSHSGYITLLGGEYHLLEIQEATNGLYIHN
jgi:hypothetical protein